MMKKRWILLFIVCAAAIAVSACWSSLENREEVPGEQGLEHIVFEQPAAIDARPFLKEDELLENVGKASEDSLSRRGSGDGNENKNEDKRGDMRESEKPIKAIVVPHHTVAAALTAECIGRLSAQQPQAVIILAPNHYNVGSAATSSSLDWQCYGRRLSAEVAAIKRLSRDGLISMNDEPFVREHSVGMLVPIIAWYLPDTKIIPILFHHGYDRQNLLEIIRALEPEINQGAVIIASIDFSHYLTKSEAEEKDREMREYLERGDAETISQLDSSYIDSPTIMAALLLYFGTETMEIITNTNSGVLMRNPVTPCTSYFTIKF